MNKQTKEWLKRAEVYEKASDEAYKNYFHKLTKTKLKEIKEKLK